MFFLVKIYRKRILALSHYLALPNIFIFTNMNFICYEIGIKSFVWTYCRKVSLCPIFSECGDDYIFQSQIFTPVKKNTSIKPCKISIKLNNYVKYDNVYT